MDVRKKTLNDAFKKFALPRSLVKFEQAFFHLLESQESSFSFFCFDPRISTSNGFARAYSSVFPPEVSVKEVKKSEIAGVFETEGSS